MKLYYDNSLNTLFLTHTPPYVCFWPTVQLQHGVHQAGPRSAPDVSTRGRCFPSVSPALEPTDPACCGLFREKEQEQISFSGVLPDFAVHLLWQSPWRQRTVKINSMLLPNWREREKKKTAMLRINPRSDHFMLECAQLKQWMCFNMDCTSKSFSVESRPSHPWSAEGTCWSNDWTSVCSGGRVGNTGVKMHHFLCPPCISLWSKFTNTF